MKKSIKSLKIENRTKYEKHLSNVKSYLTLKKDLINSNENLCIEFDYNANKILPKLDNNTRYYKRALYLYLCNFHVHNTRFSFMFNTLEGQYKKGSNSVASYLVICILL